VTLIAEFDIDGELYLHPPLVPEADRTVGKQ
jgi:hypothetical protein